MARLLTIMFAQGFELIAHTEPMQVLVRAPNGVIANISVTIDRREASLTD